jgi:2,5-diketo-D-gluconate reductase A
VDLKGEGRARSIGVANFLPEHISRLIDETGVVPAINQIELHPYLQQRAARTFHDELGIVTEAYSPLGSGRGLLRDPVLRRVGQNAGVTPAQAVLAWELAQGVVVIPKSVTPARIEENLRAVEVALSAADIAAIDGLDRSERIGPNPTTFV